MYLPREAAAKRRLRSGELWGPHTLGIKFLVGWIKSHKNSVFHSLFHSKLLFQNSFKLFVQSFSRFFRARVRVFILCTRQQAGVKMESSTVQLGYMCIYILQYIHFYQ